MKNPTIATLLNAIPGLGYIYLGGRKTIFGAMLIVANLLGIIASFDPAMYSEEYMQADPAIWDFLALISIAMLVAAFMYDAYISAVRHNEDFSKLKKEKKS